MDLKFLGNFLKVQDLAKKINFNHKNIVDVYALY